ncbi:hypothetical protein AKJ47_01370 [candidate division MSBL1 archaeon SCGC-AAA261G05]|uniref:Uncharacterized protein n=1 Tax=candidate division MSBL1 archaeon SCGC-AAA261G05 TaxID=1698276 RepID=A0A133VBW5_9EURY|nr:hypothetical protein AKJ47_01370 [candidate division MSBL1 archaeon SCGC-AAA261G05]
MEEKPVSPSLDRKSVSEWRGFGGCTLGFERVFTIHAASAPFQIRGDPTQESPAISFTNRT